MLLRGLAEEIVYDDSVAQLYAGRLDAVICYGNPMAQREYEHMLARERQKAKASTARQGRENPVAACSSCANAECAVR
jgi:hypothetical protein